MIQFKNVAENKYQARSNLRELSQKFLKYWKACTELKL